MTPPARLSLALLAAAVAMAAPASGAPSVPHLVKGPYLTGLSEDRVEVRFELDAASPASVSVAPEVALQAGTAPRTIAGESQSMHVVRVTGLDPGKAYTYELRLGGAVAGKGRFVTAPKPDSGAPLSFLVYGDDRSDETAHAALVRVMQSTPSDFLVNTGDIVADGGSAVDWQSFFRVEAPLLRERALFLAIGNHELYDDQAGANFARYFGFLDATGAPTLPYGTTRWGPARFFFLNGMHDWRDGDERRWLEAELARADGEHGLAWRVVVVHHAPWSSGPHGGNARLLDARVPELLAAHKVDLLLAGHDHIYERGDSNGLKYVISGGGGAPLYPVGRPVAATRKAESSFHFVEVRTTADSMQVVAHRVDGTIIDRCAFKRGERWDCDGPPPGSTPAAGGGSPEAPASTADSSSRCGCEVPGVRGARAAAFALVFAGLGVVAVAARRRRRG